MPVIWEKFGKATLQRLIGARTIERLESLLPGLVQDFDDDHLQSKQGLIDIFDAFYGAEALENERFRSQLFNALPPETVDALASAANIDRELPFEAKVRKLCAVGWKNREFAARAAKILALPAAYVPEEPPKFIADQLISPIEPRYKSLKDYQFPVCNKADQKLKVPLSRFVIQMPTGSGKTRVATEVLCNFLNNAPEGTVAVWLAHSEELCHQAADSFVEIWPHVAGRVLRLIRCWGSSPPFPYDFKESAFVIAGFAKLHRILSREKPRFDALRSRVALIVVDEAHRVKAPTYETVTRALMGNSTRVMGLTATPGRSAIDEEQNTALADFFFNNLITIDSGGAAVIPYLRERGVLAHVVYNSLKTRQSYTLSTKDKSYLERFFDLPPGFLTKLADDDIRNVEIVKKVETEAKAGRRILFFACSVDHSKFICALLRFLGIQAEHIDGQTPTAQRAATLTKFKSGVVNVLCNFGVLTTGFDAPTTDLIFIARPTSSIVLYSQMIGRGLRGPAIGGTEICKVVDVIDNIVGFSDQNRVYSFFDDYFDKKGEQ